MGMKNVARREAQKLSQLQDSVGMGGVVEWKRKGREFLRAGACFQFALFAADNDLAVTSLPKPPRKLQQLPLPTAQTQACVNMSDLQGPQGTHG
jgi:hypothetical protein